MSTTASQPGVGAPATISDRASDGRAVPPTPAGAEERAWFEHPGHPQQDRSGEHPGHPQQGRSAGAARPAGPPSPPPAAPRRLTRSRDDRVFGGVCGGLGRYLDTDPALVRLVAVALIFAAGSGVLAYLVAWIVIPIEDETPPDAPPADPPPADEAQRAHRPPGTAERVAGLLLLFIGAGLLVEAFVPWFGARMFWPVALVAAGVVVLAQGLRR